MATTGVVAVVGLDSAAAEAGWDVGVVAGWIVGVPTTEEAAGVVGVAGGLALELPPVGPGDCWPC